MSRPRPPRAARRVLSLWVDADDLEFLWGDLADRFAENAASRGRCAAHAALWREVAASFEPWASLRTERAEGPATRPSDRPRGRPPRLDRWIRDLIYALRSLRRRPLLTGAAVLTLTIAIGANASIFSLVNGTFLRGLPGIEDSDRLVEISRNLDGAYFDMAYPVLDEMRREARTLDGVAAFTLTPISLGTGEGGEVVTGFAVTDNYFELLGLGPAAGRFFAEDEARFPRVAEVAVISHRFWDRRFGSDAGAIGTELRVNGLPTTIIGVAPPAFGGHAVGLAGDVWVPVGLPAPGLRSPETLSDPGSGVLEALGRLAPGATAEQARDELETLANAYLAGRVGNAESNPYVVRVAGWSPVPGTIRTGVAAFLAVLSVVVGLVLAMACLNVSGMLLSRVSERAPELAIRQVLGAGRRRIVRQILTESVLLYVAGAAGGLLLAVWCTRLLMAFEPPVPIPGFDLDLDVSPDLRVAGFTVALAIASGIAFSLIPALRGTRNEPARTLRGAGRGGVGATTRLRTALVGIQMAGTAILLVGAGLFTRALASLETVDTGWETDGVAVTSLDMELGGYDETTGAATLEAVLEGARGLPGVAHAALATKLPLAGRASMGDVRVAGVEAPPGRIGFEASYNTVSPGYFETLGLQLVEGRDFRASDDAGALPVAVINASMARRIWGDDSPVGAAFSIGERSFTVVGVVEDAKYNRLVEDVPNFYYLPLGQRYNAGVVLYAKGDGDPADLAPALRALLGRVAPLLPVLPVQPLDEAVAVFFLPQRLAATVSGAMGVIALLLGIVGVYGITAFTMVGRTREIGVRLALGARRSAVFRHMLRRGLSAPGVGLLVGTAVAIGVTRFLGSFLAGVSPVDPLTFGLVVGGLFAVAGVAVAVPTRRAAAVDPATTLRAE